MANRSQTTPLMRRPFPLWRDKFETNMRGSFWRSLPDSDRKFLRLSLFFSFGGEGGDPWKHLTALKLGPTKNLELLSKASKNGKSTVKALNKLRNSYRAFNPALKGVLLNPALKAVLMDMFSQSQLQDLALSANRPKFSLMLGLRQPSLSLVGLIRELEAWDARFGDLTRVNRRIREQLRSRRLRKELLIAVAARTVFDHIYRWDKRGVWQRVADVINAAGEASGIKENATADSVRLALKNHPERPNQVSDRRDTTRK